MKTFSDLIESWPTLTAFAADVGVSIQTASSWKQRQSIPTRHWPAVIVAAVRAGKAGVNVELLARLALAKPQPGKRETA